LILILGSTKDIKFCFFVLLHIAIGLFLGNYCMVYFAMCELQLMSSLEIFVHSLFVDKHCCC